MRRWQQDEMEESRFEERADKHLQHNSLPTTLIDKGREIPNCYLPVVLLDLAVLGRGSQLRLILAIADDLVELDAAQQQGS